MLWFFRSFAQPRHFCAIDGLVVGFNWGTTWKVNYADVFGLDGGLCDFLLPKLSDPIILLNSFSWAFSVGRLLIWSWLKAEVAIDLCCGFYSQLFWLRGTYWLIVCLFGFGLVWLCLLWLDLGYVYHCLLPCVMMCLPLLAWEADLQMVLRRWLQQLALGCARTFLRCWAWILHFRRRLHKWRCQFWGWGVLLQEGVHLWTIVHHLFLLYVEEIAYLLIIFCRFDGRFLKTDTFATFWSHKSETLFALCFASVHATPVNLRVSESLASRGHW